METRTLPNPTELRAQAARIESNAQAVSDCSEYPRLAKSACNMQSEALRELAEAVETNGSELTRSRNGMTGEERRQHRAAILRIRADRLRVKAAAHNRASHDIGSRIPFGQPILVGHHSERGHRRAIDRMHSHTEKFCSAQNYAQNIDSTADFVESNGSIMSSDSDAVEQHKRKLETLERERDNMKSVNAAWKKFKKTGNAEELNALGINDIERLSRSVESCWSKQPFAPFSLTNLGARIRDSKKKIERLERDKATPEKEIESENGVKMEDCPADNRVRLFFPGKPDEETRNRLKKSGFRWSPSVGCWQAYRSALHIAKTFL